MSLNLGGKSREFYKTSTTTLALNPDIGVEYLLLLEVTQTWTQIYIDT